MKNDLDVASEWFNDNVITLQGMKPLSVTYNREGQILLIITEEDETSYWMTMLWTNFLGESGYQRLQRHEKWVSPREERIVVEKKPWWRFW